MFWSLVPFTWVYKNARDVTVKTVENNFCIFPFYPLLFKQGFSLINLEKIGRKICYPIYGNKSQTTLGDTDFDSSGI